MVYMVIVGLFMELRLAWSWSSIRCNSSGVFVNFML